MTTPKNCSKCDALMELQQEDYDVGIIGCWVCTNDKCGNVEPYEDDHYEDAE